MLQVNEACKWGRTLIYWTDPLDNGGTVPPAALSPVERQAANFALPADTGKKWSKARLVDLEELEIEELPLDADSAITLDITKKKIHTLEFLP